MRDKSRWIGWIWGEKKPSGRWIRFNRADLVPVDGHLWYQSPDGTLTRASKLPICVRTMCAASVSNPDTWGSFNAVMTSLHAGNIDGVGYVLDSGETLLDVDGCMEDGEPNAFARMCIAELGSYVERSVSGEGIHIIVVADGFMPDRGQKGARCEVYAGGHTNRYCTVSGAVLAGCDELNEDAEDVLTGIYQSEFADMPEISEVDARDAMDNLREIHDFRLTKDDERAVAWMCGHYKHARAMFERGDYIGWAKDRQTYAALKEENVRDYSRSAADFALAGYLYAATEGDPMRTLALLNASAMKRPKYDEVHDGHNLYSVMTVGKIHSLGLAGRMDAATLRQRAIDRRDKRLEVYPQSLRPLADLMRRDDVTDYMLRRVMAYNAKGPVQRDMRQRVEYYPAVIVAWIMEQWPRIVDLSYRFELEGVQR